MTAQISFDQSLFDICPTGMLALDQDTSILWLNPALERMLDLSGNELIGKDKNTLPVELHALFDETDVLHLSLNGSGERWLQRHVSATEDGENKPLSVHFYQDISSQVLSMQENDQLRQRVEELTITDELTGLANHRATLQYLSIQVTRSRRYGNPLTLGAVRISDPNDQDHPLPDSTILTFSHYLRERLRWADSIGRYEEGLFLLVMPETSQDDAINLLRQIHQECLNGALEELGKTFIPEIDIAAAAWEKGDDPQKLIRRTLQSLRT
ncbi:MAG: diguanylate cyclase [Pseudomonadota bacterium]